MSNIPEKFTKPYDPNATEESIYTLWEESGYFNPDNCCADGVCNFDGETFSIVLPPPNVTGQLHVGHAAMLAIEDIMVRFARMQGKRTLWIPGTDHAAIATQSKVEKLLSKKKIRRHDLGRDAFLDEVNKFAMDSQSTILNQVRRMGASVDWSRLAFTLDETREKAVHTAFKEMYDAGLIYRAGRIVNWDPKGQTTISDDEVVYVEEKSKFYYFKYGPFTIGTARPETKFADKYIIVHPDDKRYAEYEHMQEFEVEWINGPIKATLIKDEVADPEMGSGAMTITPWHSQVDFELAEKYDLPREQIIDKYGKLLPIAGEFEGMKITEAREKIVEKLDKKGLLEKIDEDYEHKLATAERTGGVIEPQVMEQWWIDTEKEFAFKTDNINGIKKGQQVTLKEVMLHVVRNGQVKILPERFEKVYFNWIENLRPWNISRQIWYGHRMPVWYDENNNVHLPCEQKFLFMRHAQTEHNRDHIVQGQSDSPLTEEGRTQLQENARKLKDTGITKILSSDLGRAKASAEIVAAELGVEIEYWPELREADAGEISGQPSDGRPFLERMVEAGTGESLEELENRSKMVIKKLKSLGNCNGTVLIIAHNTFTSILLSHWHGIPKEHFVTKRKQWMLKNAETEQLTIMTTPTGENLRQDEDTLDTWFSSGLWTFSTLGWPDSGHDLKEFHPTTVLETGYDIIFFWVARMILMSTFLLGDIPFETVYLHGLVRDEKGRKISKSLGNTVDPIELIEKYGADALRMALIIGTAPGQDAKLGEDKTKAYKKFGNKLWNITRFILENTAGVEYDPEFTHWSDTDKKLLEEQQSLVSEITKEISEYKYYLVGEKLYHYAWHNLADVILEESKLIFENNDESAISRKQFLMHTLRTLMITLHPFMPYITEEIWQSLEHTTNTPLMVQPWPQV